MNLRALEDPLQPGVVLHRGEEECEVCEDLPAHHLVAVHVPDQPDQGPEQSSGPVCPPGESEPRDVEAPH